MVDHLGACSPCYQEFTDLRKQAVRCSTVDFLVVVD